MERKKGTRDINICYSGLDSTVVVSRLAGSLLISPTTATGVSTSTEFASGPTPPISFESAPGSRLAVVRRSLQMRGLSGQVISLMV